MISRLRSYAVAAIVAAGLSIPSVASAQVAQPTGCPAPYTGNVCLGSGGSDLDVIIGAGGPAIVFNRAAKTMTLVSTWAPVSWPLTTPVLASPTVTGQLFLPAGTAALPAATFTAAPTTGIFLNSGTDLWFTVAGTRKIRLNGGASPGWLIEGSGAAIALNGTSVNEDATNVLALKNTGTPANQAFRVYNGQGNSSTTGAYGQITADTTRFNLYANRLDGGSANLKLGLGSSGAGITWEVDNSGHFMCITDGTCDIGGSGATRPRNYFGSGTITAGGAIAAGGPLSAGAGSNVVTGNNFAATGASAAYTTADAAFGLGTNNATRWNVTTSAGEYAWQPVANNANDIGETDHRPRKVFSGTGFVSGGSGLAVANVAANSCGTSAASIVGNNNAFKITVGATAGTQCRVTFTFAAISEWDCTVTDATTTIATRATPVDTTHTDFFGAFVAGDTVIGICFPR